MVDYFTEFQKGQINKNQFSDKVVYGALFFIYLAIVMFTTTYIFMAAWVYTGERLTRQIRERYLRAILRQNIAYFDRLGAGEVTTRITSDTHLIQDGISEKVGMAFAVCIKN
jgi:ATP-binding cassette, subfamily B (MDR/TAP), member 1